MYMHMYVCMQCLSAALKRRRLLTNWGKLVPSHRLSSKFLASSSSTAGFLHSFANNFWAQQRYTMPAYIHTCICTKCKYLIDDTLLLEKQTRLRWIERNCIQFTACCYCFSIFFLYLLTAHLAFSLIFSFNFK